MAELWQAYVGIRGGGKVSKNEGLGLAPGKTFHDHDHATVPG